MITTSRIRGSGDAFRFRDVGAQLLDERVDRGEWPNVPQPGQEVNLQRLAVERFLLADEMDFDADRSRRRTWGWGRD